MLSASFFVIVAESVDVKFHVTSDGMVFRHDKISSVMVAAKVDSMDKVKELVKEDDEQQKVMPGTRIPPPFVFKTAEAKPKAPATNEVIRPQRSKDDRITKVEDDLDKMGQSVNQMRNAVVILISFGVSVIAFIAFGYFLNRV